MKTIFKHTTHEELVKLIDIFQSKNKKLQSNFFGLSDNLEYSVVCGENAMMFRILENDYYRLYVMFNEAKEMVSMLNSIDFECVINIPTKKGIGNWDEILLKSGFEHYTTYSHYLNLEVPNMKKRPTTTGSFAKPSELLQVYSLLYRSFPIYAAHLPNREELSVMLEEKRVIADYDKDGNVCGVNIFTITGSTAYGNGWVDEGERGLEIFFDMFNIFIERKIKRFVFWVRDGNKKVIKMHELMGAKPDGLKDYTYVKNIKNKSQE